MFESSTPCECGHPWSAHQPGTYPSAAALAKDDDGDPYIWHRCNVRGCIKRVTERVTIAPGSPFERVIEFGMPCRDFTSAETLEPIAWTVSSR